VSPSARIHEVDIRDKKNVTKIMEREKPDVVFHLAAFGAYPTQTGMEEMTATNLLGCVSVLDSCRAAGVGVFVQTGSSSEYGYKDHPAEEAEWLEPNSHYAITKAAATHYCRFVAQTANMHAVTLRLYSVYGPYEEPTRLIPTLLTHTLNGRLPKLVSPQTARDFLHVDDCVDAILRTASRPDLPRGAVYNVCTGVQSRLSEVVSLAQDLAGSHCEPEWSSMEQRAWDTNVWVGSPAAFEKAVGWRSAIGLREGLSRTISWFRRNPQWLQFYQSYAPAS
jgi:nucleoside-diphosphate-sugar epimerase